MYVIAIATAVRSVPRSIAVVEGALMSVGLDTVHTGPPSPNCPPTSLPQHFKSPLSRMAQVCWVPEDIRPVPRSIAVLEGASVFVGLDEVHVGPPSPTCPYWSHPQHFTSPLSRMAQVWRSPVESLLLA